MLERITWFSKEDLTVFREKERVKTIIETFCVANNYVDINDVIELYNVKLFYDGGVFVDCLDARNMDIYATQVKNIWSKICCYFNEITNENIEELYVSIEDFIYKEYFWELYAKCKVWKNISEETFSKLFGLCDDKQMILRNNSIVSQYDNILAELLKSCDCAAEYLLSSFEMPKQSNGKTSFFPKALSLSDRDEIVSRYIDSENCNVNFVRLASNSKDHNDFKLSAKTKLKAQKRYNLEMQKMHESGAGAKIEYKVEILFGDEQKEHRCLINEGGIYKCSYSGLYIKNNFTPEDLFFNLKDLFEFIDGFGIINIVPHVSEYSFLDLVGLHSDSEYNCNFSFHVKDQISTATFIAYKTFLIKCGTSLETVVQDAFNEFCVNNGVKGLSVSMPKIDDVLSRIRCLLPEIISVP